MLDKKTFALLTAVAVSIPLAVAKDKKSKDSAKDEIQVVGHVQIPNGPVRRFLLTDHYSSVYLYAERDAGKNVTLIDVTKPSKPSVIADLAQSPPAIPRISRWRLERRSWYQALLAPSRQAVHRASESWISPTPKIRKSYGNSPP